MSRIGKKPIVIPKGVSVAVQEGLVQVKGPKGELSRTMPPMVSVEVAGDRVQVTTTTDHRKAKGMHGLARTLIQNMVNGVHTGFTRVLEVNGVGYRAEVKGRSLNLGLGYSHPIEVLLPPGVTAKVDKARLEIAGIDKEVLGKLAAVIRAQRPPEPYKGKGIRHIDEVVRRKVGKAGAS